MLLGAVLYATLLTDIQFIVWLALLLPALASAKVDFRLVPNQKPGEILAALRQLLEK